MYKKCTTFAIYGDATIDTVVNCDILFVNGNLTINKRLYAKLLIVTGNVISEHADLIVTNFHIAKNLEANCILFAGEHYANFCIVGGYCNVNQIDEHTSLSKTDPYNDALIVKGDFLCRHPNLSRKLLVSNTPNSICKIEKVIENKKFSLEANNVEITQEAKFHNIVKCYNLITQSRIFSSSSFLCDGNFTAHENVELTRLIVKGDLTILGNNIVTAHEVTVYGNIKGEIHTLKLKTYVHVFK